MKTIITVLICLIAVNNYSQESNIEIDYYPKQKEGTTDANYNKGKKGLEYVYSNLKKEYKLNLGTYWNLAASFNLMGEQPEKIYNLLVLAQKANPDDFCVLMDINLNERDIKTSSFYKSIGNKLLDLVAYCDDVEIKSMTLEDMFAKKQNLDLSGLNEPLIDRLIVLMEKDQRYRGGSSIHFKDNVEKVKKLDAEVRVELIKLFEEYGYLGKDIVGQHYQNYMCLFLEHVGKLEAQEKYLPLVAEAFKHNQLDAMPLKMLIDRIYSTKTDTQIFGSHGGVPYADDSIIVNVKKKHGFSVVSIDSVINVGSNKIILKGQKNKD